MNALRNITIAASAVLLCSVTAYAETPHKITMTCREFLSVDRLKQPEVIYWASGLNEKRRSDAAVIDVDTLDRFVPVMTEDCQKSPQASFGARLQESWSHFEADVKKHL